MAAAISAESRPSFYQLNGCLLGVEQRLGCGGFGEVFKLRELATGRVFALKQITVNKPNELESLYREINTLKQCVSHPNIVTLYGFYFGRNTSPPKGLLLMQYCDGGNLNSRLDKPGISEQLKLQWMDELASALAFLHSKGIVHRDLKPENVLLTSSDSTKLADFGLARRYTASTQQSQQQQLQSQQASSYIVNAVSQVLNHYLGSVVGSRPWLAPEAFAGHYNEKADIFSLGILFFTIQKRSFITIGGRKLFGGFVKINDRFLGFGETLHEYNLIAIPVVEVACSKRVIKLQMRSELIKQMLALNSIERPSAQQVFHKTREIKQMNTLFDNLLPPGIIKPVY